MPKMNGYEASDIIRKHNSKVKIIALTANCTLEEKEICMQHGMNEYLAKPIDIQELKRTVQSIINL